MKFILLLQKELSLRINSKIKNLQISGAIPHFPIGSGIMHPWKQGNVVIAQEYKKVSTTIPLTNTRKPENYFNIEGILLYLFFLDTYVKLPI